MKLCAHGVSGVDDTAAHVCCDPRCRVCGQRGCARTSTTKNFSLRDSVRLCCADAPWVGHVDSFCTLNQRYRDGLEEDFARYTAMAENLVAECTGLRSLDGNARGCVTNREGWVNANLASFQRLLKPAGNDGK